jgi:multiple sugar transport system permease protein
MVITSFKRPIDTTTPTLIPFVDFQPTLRTWTDIVFGFNFYQSIRALLNSIITATVSATLCVLIGGAAGYGLSRFRFAQRMMPPAVALVPLFIMMNYFRLIDTIIAIILIHTAFNLPFAIWIMKDFFDEIPVEIEEAAMVDGCTRTDAFFKIALPLAAPGLIVSWIFCLAFSWNDLMVVLAMAYNKAVTLPWMIATGHSMRALEWWTISAYGTLAIVPPMILAALIQKYIVRGLTFGAVKG